jgi:hypothetical protein
LWVRLPPVLLDYASVGHWQAPLVVTQSSDRTLAVRLRPGALTTRPVRLVEGCQALNLETRVQLPYGSLHNTAKWWNTVDTRRSERRALTGVGVRVSPWLLFAGLAGA